MKGIRTVLSMGMAFVVSAAALAFAGCSKKEEELSYTRAAYQKYLAYAEAIGDEPQSYEDWLAKIKGEKGDKGDPGEKGDKGDSGENGTIWYTGLAADRESNTKVRTGDFYLETDTLDFYLKTEDGWNKLGSLQGQTGQTGQTGKAGTHIYTGSTAPGECPDAVEGDIYINCSNGDIWIYDGAKFTHNNNHNIKGPPGGQGTAGKNGSAWYTADGTPDKATGVDGDFCLDTKNGIIYQKKSGEWQLICILQSASSDHGEPDDTSMDDIVINYKAALPDDDSEGWYKVLLKTGSTTLTEEQIKTLKVEITYCRTEGSPASYCQSRFELSAESTAEEHVYFAVVPKMFVLNSSSNPIDMAANKKPYEVKFSGIDGIIKGKVTVEKWEPAVVDEFGKEFDFFYFNATNGSSYPVMPKFIEAYSEYYGNDIASLIADNKAGCHGSAFFFDQSLYSQISGATLKLEYGADAFINVNKLPQFAKSTSVSDGDTVYHWIGDKSSTHNNVEKGKESWEHLSTDGFKYLTIPEDSQDKYFFEFCNTMSGNTKGNYNDYDDNELKVVVPLKLKVTKVSS